MVGAATHGGVNRSQYDQYDVTSVVDFDFSVDWRYFGQWTEKADGRNSVAQMGDPNKTLTGQLR